MRIGHQMPKAECFQFALIDHGRAVTVLKPAIHQCENVRVRYYTQYEVGFHVYLI